VVTPDLGEYSRSYKMFKSSLEMVEGVTMGHLKEASKGDFLNGFQSLFSGGAPDSAPAGEAWLYVKGYWTAFFSRSQTDPAIACIQLGLKQGGNAVIIICKIGTVGTL
jgi:hypothetical protein